MISFAPFLSPEAIKHLQENERYSDQSQKRTAQQIEAIYTSGQNILVSASAGSGKTFVMVERILDKILRGVSIDRLFISTFTVKAATELRERIENKLYSQIAQTTDFQMKVYLTEQLQSLCQADIGTMDAFAQKVVSRYGYSIGISSQFRIMQDKAEQDVLKQEVFSKLFNEFMNQKEAPVFRALVKNFSGNCKDTSAFRELVYTCYSFSQSTENPKIWLQENFLSAAKTYQRLEDIPDHDIELLLLAMQDTANQLRDVTDMEDYGQLTKAGSRSAKYTKHLTIIEKLSDWVRDFKCLYGKAGLDRLIRDVTDLIPSGNDVTVSKVKYPVFKTLHQKLKQFRHLETILMYQKDCFPLLEQLQDFVLAFSEAYLAVKIQESAFEFSDIAHFAIKILEENTDIRQSYQQHYHEVMVDEYQDNNHMQERLLTLLSNGHNRFMVGDIKQSIYRFRQADPQIFNQKFRDYQKKPEQGKVILLKENFRSQSEVLNVSNAVFSHLMDESVGDVLYDEQHQLIAGSHAQTVPYLDRRAQLLLYNSDKDDGNAPSDSEGISFSEVTIVAKEIIKLHNDKGVPFEDITLLVSSRTRNDIISHTFNQYGIPIVTDGGQQNYLKSVEVMVMLDTLRTINNPRNDYALVALLRSPMFAFDEDDLARIALQKDNELDKDCLYDKIQRAVIGRGAHPELIHDTLLGKLNVFLKTLKSWRRYAKLGSLYDLIWKIFNDRFYFDFVASQAKAEQAQAEQAQANLYALALRANQFEKSGYKGLYRFIKMIDKVLETQNDLADVEVAAPKQAVNLMTIHKSKGLQFPYVFILNCDKRFSMTDIHKSFILNRQHGIGIKYLADIKGLLGETTLNSVKVSMETLPYQLNKQELRLATLSEQMRLLYVAMTRAEKKVYFIGKASKSKSQEITDPKKLGKLLPLALREQLLTFQDWLLAIADMFSTEDLYFDVRFIEDSDLTQESVGRLQTPQLLNPDDLKDNRQSETIARALDMLEAVSQLNANYEAAIHLPTVRTPSQLKATYEPLLEPIGVDIIEKSSRSLSDFTLPHFSKKAKVEASHIGSALHQLMQVLSLSKPINQQTLLDALRGIDSNEEVKTALDLKKIESFFCDTSLGQFFQTYQKHLYREAPFAILKVDPISQEEYVLRGIIDAYFLFDDHIVLVDYKTDKYKQPIELKKRYQQQLELYAEALTQTYKLPVTKRYLVLMGGGKPEIVEV